MINSEELQYKILKLIEKNPEITQREIAKELGVSLGKANYLLKAIIEKGFVKAKNFKNNKNKLGYMYLLTPQGIEEKARATVRFLKRKMEEYDQIQKEIDELRKELQNSNFK